MLNTDKKLLQDLTLFDEGNKQEIAKLKEGRTNYLALNGYIKFDEIEENFIMTKIGLEELRVLEDIKYKDLTLKSYWIGIGFSALFSIGALIISIIALIKGNGGN